MSPGSIAAGLLLSCAAPCLAAPAALTGDWGGTRTQLAEQGVSLRADVTGFAQALLEGSGRRDAATSGRWDLFADLDLGKLASADGFGFHVHGEGRFGDERSSFGGQLWPSSAGAALPLGGPSAVATSLYLSKALDRGRLMLGRINALDLLGADPVVGGWGSQRFMHSTLVALPSGVVPPTIFGGVLAQRRGATSYTLMVFDPEDRTREYGLADLFSTGVNVSLGATRAGTFRGRAASLGLTATVSTKRGADLGDLLAPPGILTDTRKGSYNVALQGTQRLVGDASAPGRSLDLLVRAAIADGNPNLIRSSLVVGLVGVGLVRGRPDDRFGAGAFFYDFSNVLQDTLDPLVDFRDESGVEAWYGIALTPWSSLSVYLQAIDPARGNADTALVGGLRLNVRL